jgi:predicted chitinase
MQLTVDQFKNFFKYYGGDLEHQEEAIELLYYDLPLSLRDAEHPWVLTYRRKQEDPADVSWPLTKDQLGEIMKCSPDNLPDSLMDDLAACCQTFGIKSKRELAMFLGQCGHESGGLRWPIEIHSGTNYEMRADLGNIYPGDGVKFAGHGYLQNTGRYNSQAFSDYMESIGKADPKIMEIGKEHTGNVYPWTVSGFWWYNNGMSKLISEGATVDEVGARVNGRYLPNGFQDRRDYTDRAFKVLGV